MAVSTANALSGSGTLSSAGLGSGLDVTSIVSKLMGIERAPIDRIDSKTAIIDAQLTAYGTLQGTLSSFQTAVQTLTSTSTFSATKSTVADDTQFTAASDSTAAIGSYSIRVDKLAKAQKLQSAAFTNVTDSVGTGTLTFDFGTYTTTSNVTTFTENTKKKSVTVTIPSGSDSLSAVATAINSARAGVSATVINDGTSNYLSFSASDPGVANSLRITVDDNDGTDTDASGLSRLTYNKISGYAYGSQSWTAASVNVAAASNNHQFDIAVDGAAAVTVTLPDATYTSANIVSAMQTAIDTAVGAGKVVVALDANNQLRLSSTATGTTSSIALTDTIGNTGLSAVLGATTTTEAITRRLTETQTPQDAKVYVDGVLITKSTNTLTDAIRGVTLSLKEESATATTLTVANDTSAISTGIDTFVKEYNKVSALLSSLLAYNVSTGQSGALQSEGTVRTIQAQLRSALRTVSSGLDLTSLSEIGVSFKKDGSLSFSSSKLNTALADETNDFSAFFIGTSTAPGIAKKLDTLLESIIGGGGTLSARTDGLNDNIAAYNKQKKALEVRMASIENRYRKQFTALDTLVASMNQTSTYLTQQLAKLPDLDNGNN